MDPVIRPANSALLLKLQTAEDVAAVPAAGTDALPVEVDSISYTGPFRAEAANETNGSLVTGSPLVVGQPSTVRFRSRVKGPNATVTVNNKPPLHQAFQACGMRGQFTAAVAAEALAAGGPSTITLGASYSGTAQLYRGMPLILSGLPIGVPGHQPLIINYTSAKVATLSDDFQTLLGANLTVSTLAALPANWTYAGTSPRDAAARGTDHPAATIYLFEDGVLHQWVNCRGICDFEGDSSRPGFAVFEFSGTYVGTGTDAAVPADLVVANHSAPLLNKGGGVAPAVVIGRKLLPIARWASRTGGGIESPDDPNTEYGFGAGQLADRAPEFTCDPLATLVSVRNTLNDIKNFTQYPAVLRFGTAVGNQWALLHPRVQPVSREAGMRGRLRSFDLTFRATSAGRDSQDRDGDRYVTFY